MSLLQQNSSAPDDAARGESFTKGTSHLIWAGVIAAIVVSAAIAAYFIAGEKPPAATAEIVSLTAYTRHQKGADVDAAGAPLPEQDFDQVLLFAHLKLRNQSKNPVFVRHIMASVTVDDGVHSSYAAIPGDYERLFVAYPQLSGIHGKPLAAEPTIEPGEALEGDIVCSFRMTKEQWDARKGLDYSVALQYLPDVKVTPSVSVDVRAM